MAEADVFFYQSFRSLDKKWPELRAGGGQIDRDAMAALPASKMMDDRDKNRRQYLVKNK